MLLNKTQRKTQIPKHKGKPEQKRHIFKGDNHLLIHHFL